ncbi:MAG: hypothetical protein K6E51_05535 [Treponema sp.]|nr:hypothetical protein [Treponema sp.]
MKFRTMLILALCAFFCPLYAQYSVLNVPDSAQVRKSQLETWFLAPLEMLRMQAPVLYTSETGDIFQTRMEEQDSTFSIFVSPQSFLSVAVYNDKGQSSEFQQVFPGDACGSWVLVRDKVLGEPLYIRYYFTADADVYLQINPDNERTRVDLLIYGCYATRSLPIGVPFERFYTASFADVYNWTKKNLPWHYFVDNTGMYRNTRQMIAMIRQALPGIHPTEDAMYDEHGLPVSIATGKPLEIAEEFKNKLSLSSAGFVKWIVDGLILPIAGGCTKREPLLVPTVTYKQTGFQGIMARKYDLSFSLDWTRNLASALFSVHSGKTYLFNESGVDVTIEPFNASLTTNGVMQSPAYIKDSGYMTRDLPALLYVLSAINPEYCYLAAIRQTAKVTPETKLFNQCAVIFPYFDTNGRFSCVVFENGEELTLQKFCKKYGSDFIHLVRIQSSDRFYPQEAKK